MEYNNSKVYEWFNNLFTDGFGSPVFNPPPITIDDRPHPRKRARYTLYLLPSAIYVASENSFSTLTTTSNYPDLLPSNYHPPLHVMNKYDPYHVRVKIWYRCRKNDQKICYKKTRFYFSTCSDKNKKFYCCHGFKGLVQIKGLASCNISILCHNVSVDFFVCFPSILYFTRTRFVLVFFLFHW